MQFLHRYSIFIAWLIALIATLGSLYYSEIKNWQPCTICWYQRLFLFPLVWILGVAAFKHDHGVRIYAAPLAGIGILFALSQILQGFFPLMFSPPMCKINSLCSETKLIFGLISLAWLSFIVFVLILVLLLLAGREELNKKRKR